MEPFYHEDHEVHEGHEENEKKFKEKCTWCPIGLSHIPNSETTASIEDSEKGKGIKKFDTIDELFNDLP